MKKKLFLVTLLVSVLLTSSIAVSAAESTSGNSTSGNTVTPTPVVTEAVTVTEAPAPTEEPAAPVETKEATAATIANPGLSATYEQAAKSVVANVQQVAKQIAAGQVAANTVATIELGNYHSVSATTMTEIEKANVDVQMTYRYLGHTYTIKIPKGYVFDKSIPWYGPLYLYMLFGQNIQ